MVQIQNKVESASCVNVFFYTNSNTYTVTRLAQNILRHAHETTYKKKEKKKMKKKSIVFNILIKLYSLRLLAVNCFIFLIFF